MKKLVLLIGLIVFLTPMLVSGKDLNSPERTKIYCIKDPDNAMKKIIFQEAKQTPDEVLRKLLSHHQALEHQ